MSLCINPECKQSNPDDQLFCKHCGSEILLLGRYQVVRVLSEKGGFADTYEVMHHGTAQVMKVLKDSNPKAIELFQREFEVLNRSDHPGIPTAEEYFEFHPRNNSNTLHCLVMEKILGIDLEEYIKQRGEPIDERCALGWLEQIAQILQVIHDQKLLHRDIKPSNIILKPDGQLVLIDFGAVGRFDAAQPPAGPTFIFTPGYAAPEQTLGRAVPQSDFFSLGRTFVYLLTGKQIASMRDANGEWNWQTHVTHISPPLVQLVERMMNEAIADRPASVAELLEWAQNNRPVSRSVSNFFAEENTTANPTNPNLETITAVGSNTTTSSSAAATRIPAIPPWQRNKGAIVVGAIGLLGLMGAAAYGIYNLVTLPAAKDGTTDNNPSKNLGSTSGGSKCATDELAKKGSNSYGVVEMGSKGIKSQVVQELEQVNTEGFKYKAREEKIAERNVNPIDPATQDKTVEAVASAMKEIQERFNVPCEQIVIYGSSGVAKKAPHKEALAKAIEAATGRKLAFISADAEAKYVFDGVVPQWRRSDVITVDIGSGNTKGAFLQGKDYQTYEVGVGTQDFTNTINAKRGEANFATVAEQQKKELLIPEIRKAVGRTPALQNSRRIYLAGGISWALATLTRPCEKEQSLTSKEERVSSFTKLRAEDINTLYHNATRDRKNLFQPNLSACTPEQRQRAEKDISDMQNGVFAGDAIIAGAEILRAFSQELNFADKDNIFFARYSKDALPLGYLIQQLEASTK